MGWSGTKNGKVLALAGAAFDAFVTVDKNLPHQQNLASLAAALSLYKRLGFSIVGTLPGALRHSTLGYIDAHV